VFYRLRKNVKDEKVEAIMENYGKMCKGAKKYEKECK
jgi:hypothetical protein